MVDRLRLHPRLSLLAVLVLALGFLAGCGDDDEAPEAQPSPGDGTAFSSGDFEGLPLPPLAEPAGERSERDGVVARSYFVRNRTPEAVLEFYRDHFEETEGQVIASPEAVGNEAWRGTWLVEDRELLVSALPAPTAGGEDDEVVTQLSLELSPEGGGGHSGDEAQ